MPTQAAYRFNMAYRITKQGFLVKELVINWQAKKWRRDWDSNPGYRCQYTRFPSVLLKPLGHLSAKQVSELKLYKDYALGSNFLNEYS